jgi:hypothetical protein
MTNEAEKNPQQKQQHDQQDATGSAKTPDAKPARPGESQSQSNRPQDISKKNPSQDSDSQHQGQEKPEDEKRRAS